MFLNIITKKYSQKIFAYHSNDLSLRLKDLLDNVKCIKFPCKPRIRLELNLSRTALDIQP